MQRTFTSSPLIGSSCCCDWVFPSTFRPSGIPASRVRVRSSRWLRFGHKLSQSDFLRCKWTHHHHHQGGSPSNKLHSGLKERKGKKKNTNAGTGLESREKEPSASKSDERAFLFHRLIIFSARHRLSLWLSPVRNIYILKIKNKKKKRSEEKVKVFPDLPLQTCILWALYYGSNCLPGFWQVKRFPTVSISLWLVVFFGLFVFVFGGERLEVKKKLELGGEKDSQSSNKSDLDY